MFVSFLCMYYFYVLFLLRSSCPQLALFIMTTVPRCCHQQLNMYNVQGDIGKPRQIDSFSVTREAELFTFTRGARRIYMRRIRKRFYFVILYFASTAPLQTFRSITLVVLNLNHLCIWFQFKRD